MRQARWMAIAILRSMALQCQMLVNAPHDTEHKKGKARKGKRIIVRLRGRLRRFPDPGSAA